MHDTWFLLRHEWRQIAKEPRFLIPFLLLPLLLIGVQVFAVFFQPTLQSEEQQLLSKSLLVMLSALVSGLTVPLSADSFAGERERHTLETLLCLPISLKSLFRAKVLAVYPFPVLMAWIGQALIVIALLIRGILTQEFMIDAMKAMVLTPAIGLFLCALSTLISLKSETVRAAAQMAGIFMILTFFILFGTSVLLYQSWGYFFALLASLLIGAAICLGLSQKQFLSLK